MAVIDTGHIRTDNRSRLALRRRFTELLVLATVSVAFAFSLGIAFGVIGG
jgi:hypothetical protein